MMLAFLSLPAVLAFENIVLAPAPPPSAVIGGLPGIISAPAGQGGIEIRQSSP
jgi:hypothetical protein